MLFKSINYRKVILFLLSFLFLLSCSVNFPQKDIRIREAVMTEGMLISVETKHGKVIIKAGEGAKRSYTWEGQTLHTVLVPRKKRWHGKLGLLDDNNLRLPHKNVIHMLIEECQIHCKSITNANESLTRTAKVDPNIEDIYTDDGLFVRFRKGPLEDKYAVEFNVYQVLIKGKKPDKLSGSQNPKIRVQ